MRTISNQERQNNIDSLIRQWKERLRKMEDERDSVIDKPEAQDALERLKQRRSENSTTRKKRSPKKNI